MANDETRTTIIIRSIGRPTLQNAIDSAHREGFNSLVVVDGPGRPAVQLPNGSGLVNLGRKWGFYGGMAANVGAALARTPFITFLDDDDELVEGIGPRFKTDLQRFSSFDILIAGLKLSAPRSIKLETLDKAITTDVLCINRDFGLVPGNVAMSTFKPELFANMPFVDDVIPANVKFADYLQIRKWAVAGASIDWLGYPVYNVRPKFETVNGRGSL